MKRILSLFLACVLVFGLLPIVGHGADYQSSGTTAVPKLSQGQIWELFSRDFTTEPVFLEQPRTSAPYGLGRVNPAAAEQAVQLLNAMRRLAGLLPVELDPTLMEQTQYGAVTNAANDMLSHFPERPDGMEDDFYQKGRAVNGQSNIAYLYGLGEGNPMAMSVAMFMDDSDTNNVSSLGHRRWQLSTDMGRTGFGCARSSSGGCYITEYAFDQSQPVKADFDFIAWPASGYFPNACFGPDQAWSVSVNPEKYITPSMEDLTVTLEGGGRSWIFSGGQSYVPGDSGLFLSTDRYGYGAEQNCIIFRPDGITDYTGTYTVRIQGVTDGLNNPVELCYQVQFFDLDGFRQPEEIEPMPQPTEHIHSYGDWILEKEPTSQEEGRAYRACDCGHLEYMTIPKLENPFRDVDLREYYAEPVLWAVGFGITAGTSPTTFEPEVGCTRAQVATFLWRFFGEPEPKGSGRPFVDVRPGEYYEKAVLWAVENGITAGTSPTTFEPEADCTRSQIATFLWRAAGTPTPTLTANPFEDNQAGEYYYDAVLWAVENAITAGTTAHTFSPAHICTRGQIVTFLYRACHEQ